MAKPARRAFTMIELLITISIIALLSGMLFTAVGFMSRKAKTESSKKLMRELAAAIDDYRSDYRRLGGDGSAAGPEFNDDPWGYLGRWYHAVPETALKKRGKPPYLDLTHKSLGIGDDKKGTTNTREGYYILDSYREPLEFEVTHKAVEAGTFLEEVKITHSAGTPADTSDDWILWYRTGFPNWVWAKEGNKPKSKEIELLESL